jgi:hypothetical protein
MWQYTTEANAVRKENKMAELIDEIVQSLHAKIEQGEPDSEAQFVVDKLLNLAHNVLVEESAEKREGVKKAGLSLVGICETLPKSSSWLFYKGIFQAIVVLARINEEYQSYIDKLRKAVDLIEHSQYSIVLCAVESSPLGRTFPPTLLSNVRNDIRSYVSDEDIRLHVSGLLALRCVTVAGQWPNCSVEITDLGRRVVERLERT